MKIPRTTKIQATHFAIWCVALAALLALGFLRAPAWLRAIAWSGAAIYFVLLFLAPFGVGRMGQQLSKASREDERDAWR